MLKATCFTSVKTIVHSHTIIVKNVGKVTTFYLFWYLSLAPPFPWINVGQN